jgi:hypothetical protein
MSTIIRRRRASRMSLGPYRRHELLVGRILYPIQGYDGYGDGLSTNVADFIGLEMRADWAANRVALVEFWESGESPTVFPDCLPWLYTHRIAGISPWGCRYLD